MKSHSGQKKAPYAGRGHQGGQGKGQGGRGRGSAQGRGGQGFSDILAQDRSTQQRPPRGPVFSKYCRDRDPDEISSDYFAVRFLTDLTSHGDKSEVIEILSTAQGNKAVQKAMSFLRLYDDSHMDALIDFLTFLTSSELSVGLKSKRTMSICNVVFDSPQFIQGLLNYFSELSARDVGIVALFTVRVLGAEEDEQASSTKTRKANKQVKALIKEMEDSGDRTVKDLLQNNLLVSSEEVLRLHKKLHDNDFPMDFREIHLFPTVDELRATTTDPAGSAYRGWLGHATARHAAMLDRQFRLLREDFVCTLREELAELGNKGVGSQRCFWNPCVKNLEVNARSARGPCLSVILTLPPAMEKHFAGMKNTQEIRRFLEDDRGARILARDSVLLFFDLQGVLSRVGVVVLRDTREMAEEIRPFTAKEEEKKEDNKKEANKKEEKKKKEEEANKPLTMTVGVWFPEENLADIAAGPVYFARFCVAARTTFFSYEPILKRLQAHSTPMFESEIVQERPVVVLLDDPDELPLSVERKLVNDPSQLAAARAALSQSVTLVQGPPGTGKTYVGVQIVLALLETNPDLRIMTLCYTNHALDSFLESILDCGVSRTDIVRLGDPHRVSERLKHCCVRKEEFSKFSASASRQHFSYKTQKEELSENIQRYFSLCQYVVSSKSWRDLQTILHKLTPRAEELLAQFKTPSARDNDGMVVVGRRGRGLAEDEGWKTWCKGLPQPYWAPAVPPSPGVQRLWTLSLDARRALMSEWTALLRKRAQNKLVCAIREYNRVAAQHNELREESKADAIQVRHVLGATTTFAAKNRALMDSYAADVLIVEEAAEILEAHVLTNLGPSLRQLIMIGDHKQLRPKVEHFPLRVDSGQGINFDVSLFERLVSQGYPHFTLQVQHRMRPEISRYICPTYPALRDHASVLGREEIRGVASSVAFIHHTQAESAQGNDVLGDSSSKTNKHEVDMVMKMLVFFLQQGYSGKDMVVLTPYLGQLRLIRAALQRNSSKFAVEMNDLDNKDLEKEEDIDLDEKIEQNNAPKKPAAVIRIATVDNFQGEEAKIIIASLVRSNSRGDIGFVSGPERVNVLFSRARDGFYLLGNAETFANARSARGREMWRALLQELKQNGNFFEGFPARCATHGTQHVLATPRDFDEQCPDGGCALPCAAVMPRCAWRHACQKKCHPRGSHEEMDCFVVMEERCARGIHKNLRRCCDATRACAQQHTVLCQPAGHACLLRCDVDTIVVCPKCLKIKKEREKLKENMRKALEAERAETLRLKAELAAEEDKEKQIRSDFDVHSAKRALAESAAATVDDLAALFDMTKL